MRKGRINRSPLAEAGLLNQERVTYWTAIFTQADTMDYLKSAWTELTAKGGAWETLSDDAREQLIRVKDEKKVALKGRK